MPLEYYPPVTNMLDILANEKSLDIRVWSSKNIKGRSPYENAGINRIKRTPFPRSNDHRLLRLLKYLYHNLVVFLGLILFDPKIIFYYETYSVGPVYWYLKLFGGKKRLFIHYHEYFDQAWYDQGMALVKQYYKFEKSYLWQKAEWISHTNQFRIDLMLKAHPNLNEASLYVLPNYPPKSWTANNQSRRKQTNGEMLKFVYVGSLSVERTFLKEFCDWVIGLNGEVQFDIYAYNTTPKTILYLNNLNSELVNFYPDGVAYQNMPSLLSEYDLGVIFYKADTPNAKYCASNKLFEYLVCGLEVWVSRQQIGTKPFEELNAYPRVRLLDFEQLEPTLVSEYRSAIKALPSRTADYNFSRAVSKFLKRLTQSNYNDQTE
jgi:hypothetical protein